MTLGGGEARQIRSFLDLAEEGREMRHCVAMHATRLAYGRIQVFSLRDADGRSTAAFSYAPATGLALDEIKGVANGPAPRRRRLAAAAYAKGFNADAGASAALVAEMAHLGACEERFVPRWYRREDAIAFVVLLLGHLRPLLPPSWRAMTPHAFLSGKPWRATRAADAA